MPDRWRRIEELFEQALELPAAERSLFLDTQCAGDTALRQEVESLLACEGRGDHLFGEAVQRLTESLPVDAEAAGMRVGAYELIREIGRGGMGAVYLARRADDFQKLVAIKLVKRGMDTDELLARFRNERQILANLEHPNIVRLLDGGATEQGAPYIVMEYVEGLPLMQYCTTRKSTLEERLRLFLQVCDGVECAHRNLTAHRDLKPGNILVTASGTVKLLDFGIAKLLDDEGAHTTQMGMRLLTPDYASPEQVAGDVVTVSTDVYSLGAVLYELLSGARPHRFASLTPVEIERVVCQLDPPAPSAAARQAGSSQALDTELDNIVLMALRKEPERRYRSVAQMAEDIRRYLDGHPVIACGDTLSYRAAKFVQRHRAWVAAAVIAVVSLLGGLIAVGYQARIASQQAARAERRFTQVRALANTILFDHYDKIRSLTGATKARESLVKTALVYLDSLAQEAVDEPGLLMELAAAYERVGDVQGLPGSANLGHRAAAKDSYQKCVDLTNRAPAAQQSEPKWLSQAALCYGKLGALWEDQGDLAKARQMFEKRLQLAARHASLFPDSELAQRSLHAAYRSLTSIEADAGHLTAALTYARQSLEIAERALAQKNTTSGRGLAAASHSILAGLRLAQGDLPGALDQVTRQIAIREQLARRYPSHRPYQRALFEAHWMAALVLAAPFQINLGDPVKGAGHCRQSLAYAQRLANADAEDLQSRKDLSSAYSCLGGVLLPSDPAAALASFRQELAITRPIHEAFPTELRYAYALASTHLAIGEAYRRLRQPLLAKEHLEKSCQLHDAIAQRSRLALYRQERVVANRTLGLALAGMGESAAAQSRMSQALELARQTVVERPTPMTQAELAETLSAMSKLAPIAANRCRWGSESAALWELLSQQSPLGSLAAKRKDAVAATLRSCP